RVRSQVRRQPEEADRPLTLRFAQANRSDDGPPTKGDPSGKECSSMKRRLDPELAQLLPKLPLRDSRILTPSIAREQLLALAQSRHNIPLPQPAAVADVSIPGPAGPLQARVYRPNRMPAPTLDYFHGGGWVAGDLNTHDRQARLLAIG